MTKLTIEFIKEVETKLDNGEKIDGIRSYAISYKGVGSTVRKLRRLGYKVVKRRLWNHYTVSNSTFYKCI